MRSNRSGSTVKTSNAYCPYNGNKIYRYCVKILKIRDEIFGTFSAYRRALRFIAFELPAGSGKNPS
jgi:hypothetical protein